MSISDRKTVTAQELYDSTMLTDMLSVDTNKTRPSGSPGAILQFNQCPIETLRVWSRFELSKIESLEQIANCIDRVATVMETVLEEVSNQDSERPRGQMGPE